MQRALIVASGASVDAAARAPKTDFCLAADGGLEVLQKAGLSADIVVGDLDSASPQALAKAKAEGARIMRFPKDKAESDLELALAVALENNATEVHVLLANGGRLDHQLANFLVLCSERWKDVVVDATIGTASAWVVRGARTLTICKGEHVSLHALGGPAKQVFTTNLHYNLDGADLPELSAMGIANYATADSPTIQLAKGTILAISDPSQEVSRPFRK